MLTCGLALHSTSLSSCLHPQTDCSFLEAMKIAEKERNKDIRTKMAAIHWTFGWFSIHEWRAEKTFCASAGRLHGEISKKAIIKESSYLWVVFLVQHQQTLFLDRIPAWRLLDMIRGKFWSLICAAKAAVSALPLKCSAHATEERHET